MHEAVVPISLRPALVVLVVVFAAATSVRAQEADSLTLPVYHLEVPDDVIATLEANPWSHETYPAVIRAGDETFDCEVRYRGGSSLTLPKKSWRIEFDDADNPFGAEKVNLRAEYRDRSLMRNHLVHRLFQYHGYPAPDTRHVSLFLNGRYVGVYLDAERVDEEMLERYDQEAGWLYKISWHAGTMAPLLFPHQYAAGWAPREEATSDPRPVQELVSKLAFWTPDDFEAHVGEVFDIDRLLFYYAVQVAVGNYDGIQKNFYLHLNPDTRLYEFIPWDMDATLGSLWTGEYEPVRIRNDPAPHFSSTLFQRMMEYEQWSERLQEMVYEIAETGFPFMSAELEETYAHIRHDVYEDPEKKGPNEDFETAVAQLRSFLEERAKYLRSWPRYSSTRLHELTVSNPFPTDADPVVTVRARWNASSAPELRYVWDIDYDETHRDYRSETVGMYDDGQHGDGAVGDGVYGATLDVSGMLGHAVPLGVKRGGALYPSASVDYGDLRPTAYYGLNASGNTLEQYQGVRFGELHRRAENVYVPLVNPNPESLDLSYCYIQAGVYYRKLPLPPGTTVAGGDTLIVATNAEAAGARFPGTPAVGGLFFDVAVGDTVRLLSPMHTVLAETEVTAATELPPPYRVVINEINYNAADEHDTEDWVELYNAEPSVVDASGWVIMDEEDDHRFVLPEGTIIPSSGFAVVSRDAAALRALHPDAGPLFGDMDFGLSGSGELVRLYTDAGESIDAVTYSHEAPWPVEADGEGATLELVDAGEDNALVDHWRASAVVGGTPGAVNSVSTKHPSPPSIDGSFLAPSYPNPFGRDAILTYQTEREGHVELAVYDVLGRRVRQLVDGRQKAGSHAARLDGDALAAGVYYVVLRLDGRVIGRRQAVRL